MSSTRVYLEAGRTWVFACAVDWPGWCRRGKGEDAALEALQAYEERYRLVVGSSFRPGPIEVVGSLAGNATTDFGAPDRIGEWDVGSLTPAEAGRLTSVLESCWAAFDGVVAGSPPSLRKGPRGGGRDRDAIVEHVREAERSYGRQVGARVPPRTPWAEQRAAIGDALRSGASDGKWPPRYAVRRIAWHVLDHAWEIEDRTEQP